MTLEGIQSFLTQIEHPGWRFRAKFAGASLVRIEIYIIDQDERDVVIETLQVDHTWTRSQIVKTLFDRVQYLTAANLAQTFKYRGRPIFTQAYDVDRLWEVCEPTNMEQGA